MIGGFDGVQAVVDVVVRFGCRLSCLVLGVWFKGRIERYLYYYLYTALTGGGTDLIVAV